MAKTKSALKEEEKKKPDGKVMLDLVEKLHEEKKISRDVIFGGIEAAIQLAAERHFGITEENPGVGVHVHIDRATGDITARHGEQELDPETLGRIAAQSAKQVMIQKIREAESDTVFSEYAAKKGELVVGTITRVDAGTAIVSLGKSESLLPRSEQIPGETHHVGERVKAVVFEVRKTGHRVKIVLSRAHPDFVKSLFDEEIPEIQDRTIDIRATAREAGYRSKIAVSSIDSKVDCVGACVGVRGSRIKNIIEELNGERIDIVRWNDSLQVLIPNALQPAEISDVFTYPRLGRAIVLVQEDQLSLAIGRRGQNVRLASKLVGMDIEIMTHDELGEALERAERWFAQLPIEPAPEDGTEPARVGEEVIQAMIEEGFLSYNELTFIDAEELTKFTGLTEEQADEVLMYAEEFADHMDRSVQEEQRAAEEAAVGDVIADTDPTTPGPDAASFAGEATEDADAGGEELATEETEATLGRKPRPAYHEGMPTDLRGVQDALEHEEQRSGEDGEMTTPPADKDGETA